MNVGQILLSYVKLSLTFVKIDYNSLHCINLKQNFAQ